MRKLDTEPSLVEGNIIEKVGARVLLYDLDSQRCEILFKLFNSEGMVFCMEMWDVPPTALENWGYDDTVIFQAIADYKGFTLKK
jgi:hypothetical protein